MEVWQTVLLAIGGNAVALTILGWLAKSLVGGMLERDFERFKTSLTQKSDSALEQLKHDLQLTAMEHEVRFSKLHERRGQVIAETYALLTEAQWGVGSFVSMIEWHGEPKKPEKYVTAMNAVADFFRYFEKNRIFLPASLCTQLEEFVEQMRRKAIGFGVYVRLGEEDKQPQVLKERHEAWTAAWEYFNDKVPPARKNLEDELRKLLGPPEPPLTARTTGDKTP